MIGFHVVILPTHQCLLSADSRGVIAEVVVLIRPPGSELIDLFSESGSSCSILTADVEGKCIIANTSENVVAGYWSVEVSLENLAISTCLVDIWGLKLGNMSAFY